MQDKPLKQIDEKKIKCFWCKKYINLTNSKIHTSEVLLKLELYAK